MISKTSAIVVRIRHWSQTSHMVTWLTPNHGLITTSVKGACRPKSAFLGQYDLAYTCEMLYYTREYGGVHPLRECTPLQLREPLRHNWRAGTAASYYCDMAASVTLPMQDTSPIYHLLETALDHACNHNPRIGHLLAYEIPMLHHLGLQPDLTPCPTCHTPDLKWIRFSLASGRLLCAHASPVALTEPAITLHRDVIAAIRATPTTTNEWQLPSDDNIALGIRRFLGMFIRYHLDLSVAARRVAYELLSAANQQ